MKGVPGPRRIIAKQVSILVDDEALVGVQKVSPVDIDMKTESEKHALHQFYQELLDTITFPITLYSRQRTTTLEPYIDNIKDGSKESELRAAYLNLCKSVGDADLVTTDQYVLIRVPLTKHDNPHKELYRRQKEVATTLQGGHLTVTQLKYDGLKQFAERVVNREPVPTREFCATPSDGFDRYRKLLYVDEYPAELEFGWPRHVLRVEGLVDVQQVVRPIKEQSAIRTLRRQSEKLDTEITTFLDSGYRGVNKLERSLDDVEWFLDLLARQECRPVKYGAYITVDAASQDEAEAVFDRVTSRLRALQIKCKEPAYRNDQAYYTDSPFYTDRLNETLLMPSLSAATGFPFGTQQFDQARGVLYGVDTEDEVPILVDRFRWNSHSMAVMGTLGSGKSYLAKLELLRSTLVYPDLQIIVVDPKKEYSTVVEALDGNARLLDENTDYQFESDVVGFEPTERGDVTNVAALVDVLGQIYAHVSKNTDRTLVLIDEAHNLLDDDEGRRVLNQFVLEARDINTAVHMVTQSASHFTDYRQGRDILKHVSGKLFFRHDEMTESMEQYFDLSDREKYTLLRLRGGKNLPFSEALLRVSNTWNTRLRIQSSGFEHQLIEAGTESE